MVAGSIFSKSVEHAGLGVWLLGFAKLSSSRVEFCCLFMPAGSAGIKAEQVLAKCRHTNTHVHTWTAHVSIRTHPGTPQAVSTDRHTQAAPMALSCSSLQLSKRGKRHREDHTITAYTAWRGSYTGKEKVTSPRGAMPYHPQQQLHPKPWGFPRRAPEQSSLPRESCRVCSWRLSSWSLVKPRLAQAPVALLKRRSKLSLNWGSRVMSNGGPRCVWSGPGGWTTPTPLMACRAGSLQRCPPNSIPVALQMELS